MVQPKGVGRLTVWERKSKFYAECDGRLLCASKVHKSLIADRSNRRGKCQIKVTPRKRFRTIQEKQKNCENHKQWRKTSGEKLGQN